MSRKNIQFDGTATHYCKYCNTWGTPGNEILCGNCGEHGCLMPNPFPDNLIPYVYIELQDAIDD